MKIAFAAPFVVLAVLFTRIAPLAAATPDFEQVTAVTGKVPVDLRGAWFLVPQPEITKGKYRSFPEVLLVARQKDGQPAIRLLDVRLPPDVAADVKTANEKLEFWKPSDSQIAALRRGWSKLPPSKNKDVGEGDHAYDRVDFRLATPESYAELFPKQDDALKGVLSDSIFTLVVFEQYRALPVPPGSNIIQVMSRKSVYGFRSVSDQLLEGTQLTGFMVAHPMSPLPFNWKGSFTMYRLASAKDVGKVVVPSGAAKPATTQKHSSAKKSEPKQ